MYRIDFTAAHVHTCIYGFLFTGTFADIFCMATMVKNMPMTLLSYYFWMHLSAHSSWNSTHQRIGTTFLTRNFCFPWWKLSRNESHINPYSIFSCNPSIHPRKLTWNLKIPPCKGRSIYKPPILSAPSFRQRLRFRWRWNLAHVAGRGRWSRRR